jgi:twitching motility protein PilT
LPPIAKTFASRPHGLVLITGPAGSGKSTTMASMIDYINHRKHVHVVCIEDPVEYVHRHDRSIIDQREILQDAHSFNEALRSVFRQSPDIIMVGELRDFETIQLALILAETGHLIMGTLHTHDATSAVSRIVSVFPPAEQQQIHSQLSMVLLGVISQNLIPSIDDTRVLLAYEVMNVNGAIRNMIREGKMAQIYSAIQTGRDTGMITMNESLKDLCDQGRIDRSKAMDRSPDPGELAHMLGISG